MAAALSEMAHRNDIDVLIRLISDPANGPSRIFFVKNRSRSKTPEAFDMLMRLSTRSGSGQGNRISAEIEAETLSSDITAEITRGRSK